MTAVLGAQEARGSTAPTDPSTGSGGKGRSAVPTREEAIDAVGSLVLGLVAIAGLLPIFEAPRPMVVAVYAAVVGIGVAVLTARLRLGPTATTLVVGGAFLLASGPAAPETAIGGILPGLGTPAAVVDGLIRCWADILTTQLPVAPVGTAAVLPYLVGWVAGGGAMLVARRSRSAGLPAVPPLVAMLAVIFLGADEPFSILLQGGVFFAVAVVWGANRGGRDRRDAAVPLSWGRVGAAVAMVVLVLGVALLLVPATPVEKAERFTAREEVLPPFDPREHPSPLASFGTHRREGVEDEVLFRAEGLSEGDLVRLAVMDDHDGVVWVVGGPDNPESGRYVRVGAEIAPTDPDPSLGEPVDVELTVEDYRGVWVPTVGVPASVRFGGPEAVELEEQLRYNDVTTTAGTARPLTEGDVVRLEGRAASLSAHRSEADDERLADARPAELDLPALPSSDPIVTRAQDEAASATTPFEQALALETWMQQGGNSDLLPDGAEEPVANPTGHSLLRLEQFLAPPVPDGEDEGEEPVDAQLVGNDEQYAATMAYAARSLGLPARVVLGIDVDADADPAALTRADVEAWVEIAFEGEGWVPFFPTPDQPPEPVQRRQPRQEPLAQQEPPPDTFVRPPQTLPEVRDRDDAEPNRENALTAAVDLVRWLIRVLAPISPFLIVIGSILGAKAWRRRLRRGRGSPIDRISGAWRDMLDTCRDRGVLLPRGATRLEVARSIPAEVWPDAEPMAVQVDALMFGPSALDDATAAGLWAVADDQRKAVRRGAGRWTRIKAALSLRSFRRLR